MSVFQVPSVVSAILYLKKYTAAHSSIQVLGFRKQFLADCLVKQSVLFQMIQLTAKIHDAFRIPALLNSCRILNTRVN